MTPKKSPRKRIEKDTIEQSLKERRKLLLDEIRRDVFRRFQEEHGDRYEGAMDTGDMSVADLLESVGFKLAGIREEELRKIAEAERKIQNGTYRLRFTASTANKAWKKRPSRSNRKGFQEASSPDSFLKATALSSG